ncbi:putative transcription factor C3H family [Helianthus debilis subsp. tardiflorus]
MLLQLKTGLCKFGIACKFHYAQPINESMRPAASRPIYSTMQYPSHEQYVGPSAAGYRVVRPSIVHGSFISTGCFWSYSTFTWHGSFTELKSLLGGQSSVYGVNTLGLPYNTISSLDTIS